MKFILKKIKLLMKKNVIYCYYLVIINIKTLKVMEK